MLTSLLVSGHTKKNETGGHFVKQSIWAEPGPTLCKVENLTLTVTVLTNGFAPRAIKLAQKYVIKTQSLNGQHPSFP